MSLATGTTGQPLETAMPILATLHYGDAAPADMPFFIATRTMIVTKIMGRPVGSAAGATGVVRKVPSGTATASGTALHSGNFTFDGTANTNQTLTLSTTPANLKLAAGDALGLDVTGTLTGATGCITVELIPTA